MKNISLLILGLLFANFIVAQSEVIWTDPEFPTVNDDVIVYFDATKGNGELTGFTGDVYAHTGVITNESNQPSDWKHVVGNWGTPDERVLMERVDTDLYTLSYNIDAFYNINPGEEVLQLAFVFRNADGGLVGRESDGGDIFTPVFSSDESIFVTRSSPSDFELVLQGDSVHINLQVNQELSISITDNQEELVNVVADHIDFKYVPDGKGNHDLIYKFKSESDSLVRQSTVFVIDTNQIVEDPPIELLNGLNVLDNEVYFQLHAPNKEYCFFLTEANEYMFEEAHRMKRSLDGERFWISFDNSFFNNEAITYQYYVSGDIKIADPYSELVLDPSNDWAIDLSTFEGLPEYPESLTSGIVTVFDIGKATYPWLVNDFEGVKSENLIIYETLMRDFLEDHNYSSLKDTLSYLKRLGINAIQLMPVSEFEGNNSWGYNPSFHMALDKYYGSPQEFKAFVDAAHQEGIAVILDIVYNHVFSQSPLAQLYWDSANFRPSGDNPWLNVIPKHPFNVGYDVNHEYAGTKEWVKQTIAYWMDEYKIDGFRFDLSKGFTQKNSGSNAATMAQYDKSRIDILTDYANFIWSINENAYVIMEHFADNIEERELSENGMMMWANESHQFAEAAMGYNSRLRSADYTWRNFEEPNLIVYMESHDEERMGYKLLNFGNQNGSYDTRTEPILYRRVEAATVFYFSIPGPKMLWKFGELAYDFSINRCTDGSISNDCRLSDKPITWEYTENEGRSRLYDINSVMAYLKDDLGLFDSSDFNLSDNDNFVKSIVLNTGDETVVTIVNFNVEQEDIEYEFPFEGEWFEYFSQTSVTVGSEALKFKMGPGEYRLFSSNPLDLSIDPIFGELNVELESDVFTIQPNPVAEGKQILVSGLTGSIQVDFVDSVGRLIHSDTLVNGVFDLPKEITPGLYYIIPREENDIEPVSIVITSFY